MWQVVLNQYFINVAVGGVVDVEMQSNCAVARIDVLEYMNVVTFGKACLVTKTVWLIDLQ